MPKMKLDKNVLKKKIAGLPVPLVAVAAGGVAWIIWKRHQAAAGSGVDPGTAADYSGGTADAGSPATSGGGGSAGGAGDASGTSSSTDNAYPQPITNNITKIFKKGAITKVFRRGGRGRPVVRNRITVNVRNNSPNRVVRPMRKQQAKHKPPPKLRPGPIMYRKGYTPQRRQGRGQAPAIVRRVGGK